MIVNHDVVLSSPQHISKGTWHSLHQISVNAYGNALNRPLEQVEQFSLAHDFDRFYEQQLNPNARLEAGATQQYYDPTVAVAYCQGRPVGYAYAANNISGESPKARQAKYALVAKRYFWIGNLVVAPEHREHLRSMSRESQEPQERVGVLLLRKILSITNRMQPVTAYAYPDEYKPGRNAIQPLLEQVGMHQDGQQMTDMFGTGAPDTRLVRFKSDMAWISRYKAVADVPPLYASSTVSK